MMRFLRKYALKSLFLVAVVFLKQDRESPSRNLPVNDEIFEKIRAKIALPCCRRRLPQARQKIALEKPSRRRWSRLS